nr:DUF4004 family protein [uncultured Cellulosilyticum sp.]
MDELISKKDLLETAKISYGQLYRWKRMDLIPEEWFIKKATPTGQETFFVRDKILERIELILSMKDTTSLDEIAEVLGKKEGEKTYKIDALLEKGAISPYTKEVFCNIYEAEKGIAKKELLILAIIEKYILKSVMTVEELKLMVQIIEKEFEGLYTEEGRIYLLRKYGVSFVMGCKDFKQVVWEEQAVKVVEVELLKEVSQMNKALI